MEQQGTTPQALWIHRTNSVPPKLQDQISEMLKPYRVCQITPIVPTHCCQSGGRAASRFVVLCRWRAFLVFNKQPLKVEHTFSFMDISSIYIPSHTQMDLEMDGQTLSFSVLHTDDLDAIIGHMTASLKRIFPDSSPGNLLKTIPTDLQERLHALTEMVEEQLNAQPSPCGGFSDTYAALCDFNEMQFKEEIQWDLDNIYHIHNSKVFNLQDFSHLDSRDLALAVAALSFNQWFIKIHCKELKLSMDIQQQLTFLLSRSPSLQEISLEGCGLKSDFGVKMAAALQERMSCPLQSINLSGNPIEDKGVLALSPQLHRLDEGLKHLSLSCVSMTAKGLGSLGTVLSSNKIFPASLTHLDLSKNPGSLSTEDAMFLFSFLSSSNSLSHLDLSDTSCPLDTLFVSLSAGCCSRLQHLNLARNPFSHRKVRDVTRSIQQFFSQSWELKYVGLSATKLPAQALRLLLQGLATNNRLLGLELDLSSCELRSAGAQVIQEHISEATAIKSLDISDNGFENHMVTLVLSVGRCPSLRQLSLGKNFAMKSRALSDLLHRIAQLIQDEECPLQSLSVCDSKLKSGVHILLSALGGHAALTELDISGNNIGDTGAKMLGKALMTNTKLRTLLWDRNNVSARGFQDVAEALERNFSLQKMPLPLADITQSYRSNPEGTKEALNKIQLCLDRNNQRQCGSIELQQAFSCQQSEKLIQEKSRQLEDSLHCLSLSGSQEVQSDVLASYELLQNAREALKLLPSLCEEGWKSAPDGDSVKDILRDAAAALTDHSNRSIQELARGLMGHAEGVCPRVVQRSSVCMSLSDCVSRASRQTHDMLWSTLVEGAGQSISSRLRELRHTLTVTLVESVVEQLLQDLTDALDKMNCLMKENSSNTSRFNIPELRLADAEFPTDDYTPAFWRNSLLSKSLRPAASLKSLLDADWEQQSRGSRTERQRGGGSAEEDGGGRCTFPPQLTATSLPLKPSSPSPSPFTSLSPSPPVERGRRWMEGEVVPADAAEGPSRVRGASFIPLPGLPPLYSISTRAPLEEEEEEAAGFHRREVRGPLPGTGFPASPMEPLPSQGQTLRHYTATRPRPRRTHTQPPSSRPQEAVSKEENESSEVMGRVDEGVEEFFTKRIIPDYALKGRWEDSNPAQPTPSESSSTLSASPPFSSSSDVIPTSTVIAVTCPPVISPDTSLTSPDAPPPVTSSPCPTPVTTSTTPTQVPTKNIKKKFGDFFAFKRPRASRAAKASGGEGGAEGVKVKRTSIADLIRPLREAKERDKDRDKDRGARSVEDANLCNDAIITEGIGAGSAGGAGGVTAPAETLPTTMPPRKTTPSPVTITTSPDIPSAALPNLDEAGAAALSLPPPEQEVQAGQKLSGERRLRVAKKLREGKSQSLILLTGSESEDKDSTASKKHASESGASFEQRLQVMLQRIGVTKTPPADTKMCQNKDEELRKANSEGAILDKPNPAPTCTKPRTMSTSSADPRLPLRALDPIRPDQALHPKPALPERPVGLPPPKPAVAVKPPFPTPPTSAGRLTPPPMAPPTRSPTDKVQLATPPRLSRQDESEAQNGSQESPASSTSPRKDLLCPVPAPRRGASAQDRFDKAQSQTDESLPKPGSHMKPPPQRRAVSVHEDALAMTQELKSVLQRSPICFRGNKWDLPSFSEDEAQRPHTDGESKGAGDAAKLPPPGKEQTLPPSAAQAQHELSALHKAPSGSGTSAGTTPSPGRPSSTAAQKDGSSPTSPPQISDRPLVSPPSKETAPSIPPPKPSKTPHLSPKHQENGSCTAPPPAGLRNSTQERHEHRTDPPSSE
ncbi:Leucine-rich repeat-containing protein 16B [Oryzias melastigma]|uniref:Leucine-rich repeat-containing protein 16B n=1 Tax=Oryzias melastigma TaxID=30732 RepID=A0A834BRZ8_ORYME|nr:Leucine-rich repeat-containing protein 16B [Oryzias melastigma]